MNAHAFNYSKSESELLRRVTYLRNLCIYDMSGIQFEKKLDWTQIFYSREGTYSPWMVGGAYHRLIPPLLGMVNN